jgi:hypothetical protein
MFATKRGKPQTYLLQVSLCKKKYWNIIGIPVPTWLKPKRAMRNLRKRLKVSFAMEIIIVTYVVVHMN